MRIVLILFLIAWQTGVASAQQAPLPLQAAAAELALQEAEQTLAKGQPASARLLSLKSRHLFRAAGDSVGVVKAEGQLGKVLEQQDDNEGALREFLYQLLLARRLHNPMFESRALANVADVMRVTQQNEKALEYYRAALAVQKQHPDSSAAAEMYAGLSSTFANVGAVDSARLFGMVSLKMAQSQKSVRGEATAWSRLAKTELVAENYALARKYLARHIALMQQVGDKTAVAQALKNMANIVNHQQDFPAALRYSLQSLELLKQTGDKRGIKSDYDALAAISSNLNHYEEALTYQRLAEEYQDSVLTEANLASLAEMQIKYETGQKEAQNRLQTAQLRTQQQVIRRRNTQLLAGLLVALLLASLAYLLYNHRRLRREVEFAHERQQLERLRTQAVLEAEETERRRIGSDLHDGVGQLLTAAKLNLHALGEQLNVQTVGQQTLLQNALDVVDESFREVRGISHNLMPNALIKRGLAQAVRDFLDKVTPDGRLKINLEVAGLDRGGRLEPTTENVLFRVIQELVQNILKHARATEVTLQIIRHPEELTVLVEDNGVGFDPAALGAEAGIGLRNIESRMAFLGGWADFDAAPGRGTTVTLEVPLLAVAAG